MLKYALKRFKEPSTLAGFAVLASFFGVPATTADLVVQAVAAVCAAGAVLLPEQK